MTGTRFSLEVQPVIPTSLKGLKELANDLLYSWDRQLRRLFSRLDPDLWLACGHNPKVFLRRISHDRLLEADQDRAFREDYNRVLAAYNSYHKGGPRPELENLIDPENLSLIHI